MFKKEMISEKILNDNFWLIRSILAIYNLQTSEEKSKEHSKFTNGVGFNKPDSAFFTSIAKKIQRVYNFTQPKIYKNGILSDKQLYVCRKRMVKYSGQLAKIANKEI